MSLKDIIAKELTKTAQAPETNIVSGTIRERTYYNKPNGDWGGSQSNKKFPYVFGSGAWESFIANNKDPLPESFSEFAENARKEQALMNQYFDTKDYESHNYMLRKLGHVEGTMAEEIKKKI